MKRITLVAGLCAAALAFQPGAAGEKQTATVVPDAGVVTTAPDALQVTRDVPPVTEDVTESQAEPTAESPEAPAETILLDVYSINGGGRQEIQAGDLRLGVSVAQSVAGVTSAGGFRLGLGYWHMVADLATCPVTMTGDVNLSGSIVLSDAIFLVNYVLKGGPEPLPCPAAGDVNCDGEIKTSDIIHVVNYVLRAGPAPCDVCTMIPGTWTCP